MANKVVVPLMPSADSVSSIDNDNYEVIIPTIDYSMLFSNDPDQRSNSLHFLNHVSQNYGCFHLVNHGVPQGIIESVLKGISDFFDPTDVENRRVYAGKNLTGMIKWGMCSSQAGDNREHLNVVVHPQFHCPPKPPHLSAALEEYWKRLREVELGLAKAMSRALGFEECYIEKALDLKSGLDVFATNLYPPNFMSKGRMGLVDHTDPGLFVSLIQDVNGGLQVLSHDGKWVDVNMLPSSIFIIFSDHLEILTNGKCKSKVHRVVVGDNKVRRISASTLHGPSSETFVKPAMEFVDDSHPAAYRGMTYKQSLEANGFRVIDIKSSLQQMTIVSNI